MEQHTHGPSVSRIGLGMAALGRPGYINLYHADDLERNYDVLAMERGAHAVIDAAWAAGVRWFDTARSYGRGEVFLGSWLHARAIPLNDVTVSSKWGYMYTANWQVEAAAHEVKEHTLALLQQQYGESVATLGDYLRLYQIHSATRESGVLENRDVLRELARLRANGVQIGLSVSGPVQAAVIQAATALTVDGERLFSSVQATWNVLDRSAGTALAEAHAAGMRVLVKEALANGRLTERNIDPAFAAERATLEREAARLGASLDALALAAVLAQPWAGVVLSGATTTAQLHSNLAALAVLWDVEADAALATLAEAPAMYWAQRSALPWN